MEIEDIRIVKKDKRGVIYDCDKLIFIERKAGSIGADHTHEQREVLFLIEGELEITVEKDCKKLKAPCRIEIGANKYHKLVALTEVKLLEYRF